MRPRPHTSPQTSDDHERTPPPEGRARRRTAALLWGLAAALVFHLLMRAVAEVTSTATTFSLGGTAFIAIFAAMAGVIGQRPC
jgi:predicted tellurium resistance membrane protein TerC